MVVNATALSIVQQQAMFFEDPINAPNVPGTHGTLYLLRRDVNDMRSIMPQAALWPRAMAIMAGIDLLAKFFANDDAQGAVGNRFRNFLARFITRDNAPNSGNNEALFQFRNSLLHSFGWFSIGRRGAIFRFTLTQSPQNWLVRQDPANAQNWVVNLRQLETEFDQGVNDYISAINDPARPERFPSGNNIFERYGWMNIV